MFSCKENKTETKSHKKTIVRKQPKSISYSFQNTKDWLIENESDASKINIVTTINRTDNANLAKMDSIIVPKDFAGDLEFYLPFPLEVENLNDVSKILIFSYATQTFAAYEYGTLTYSGPTNMGRKADPTPTGLFFTNWKAEQTTSTFNDEWDLKWNFNIENKLGVGFHEYALPGYPASHSCLRLREKDAKYLYDWADQWVLKSDTKVEVKGTPVIVFGSYPFDGKKPWLDLVNDSKVLNFSESDIKNQVAPFLDKILKAQATRENYKSDEETM